MTDYTRDQMRKCTAKICLNMGWHSTMTAPLDILTDIMSNYINQLAKTTNDYAVNFGRSEPNADHVALAFRDYNINLPELEEYVKNVDFVEPPTSVPKYPLPKEVRLNFLKPGSQEVVTRPVHIHEHLPPMYPEIEVKENLIDIKTEVPEEQSTTDATAIPIFKRPAELPPSGETFKRPRLVLEDESRPTREISSVMMTTSGFLSPAREGKLPESRTPTLSMIDPVPTPMAPPHPPQVENNVVINKKIPKLVKKGEKRKDRISKELFKPVITPAPPVKKNITIKESSSKSKKQQSSNSNKHTNSTSNDPKFNKALAAARLKTEKLNTTITPIIPPKPPVVITAPPPAVVDHVDKLFTEPDKRKVNILKKISVKNEKGFKIKEEVKLESRESSPDLIIDESFANSHSKQVHHLSNDITIELVNNPNNQQSTKSPCEKTERSSGFFDEESPPGTPMTPKTPELIAQSSPVHKGEKRKRKDKSKIRKMQKHIPSPNRLDSGSELDCPKTPEAHLMTFKQEKIEIPSPPVTSTVPPNLPFPFFNHFAAGPGLIPNLGNNLFQHLQIPPFPSFGQPPYLPPVHPGMPMNFIPQLNRQESIEPPQKPASVPVTPNVTSERSSGPVVPSPTPLTPTPHTEPTENPLQKLEKVLIERAKKEHKKEKKEKKKNKKDKLKDKAEKKKLKEEKKDKERLKKEKRAKKKEKEMLKEAELYPKLTLKIGGGAVSPAVDTTKATYTVGEASSPPRDQKITLKLNSSEGGDFKKLNIKPIVKKEDESNNLGDLSRELSPELAKISALVTGPSKPKTSLKISGSNITISTDNFSASSNDSFHTKINVYKPIAKSRKKEIPKEPEYSVPTSYIDENGKEVWICPACNKRDDGTAMIGCDDCDAWYHWICVGIQVEPDPSEDWYCRTCILKKQSTLLQMDKKKKRKKKEKKQL